MLEYRNKLQTASFRGVTFGVREINTTMGRRSILHEYPYRDEPYAEDLGRKAREFSINAFVMNPNDFSASRQLASVLEDYNTPGTFVHPSMGQIQVIPKECTHTFSNQEGGIEYFSVTFVETFGNNFPSVSVDTQSLIRSSVNNLLDTSNSYFADNFRTANLPDFIAQSAQDNLNAFSAKFRSIINFGSARNDNPTAYSKLIARLNDFNDAIPVLVTKPAQLAQTINQLNSDLNATFPNNLGLAMLMQARLYEYGDGFVLIVASTNLREIEKVNQDQLIYLIKASALAMMIRNVASMTFDSSDDAIATRDSIDEKASTLLLTLANNFDDEIYKALDNALSSMIQDIRIRSANLATIRSYQLADSLPSLVLAYEYLDDSTQDEELVARNKVENPLFVPANSTIKVVGT